MKIIHIIPRPSIFENIIKHHAEKLGHECFFYTIKRRLGMDRVSFLKLYHKVKQQPDSLFVFHRVPHSVALLLSYLIKDFRYALIYWGEDYYSNFLSETIFEAHCIEKSPLLSDAYYQRPVLRPRATWRQKLQTFIGLLTLKRAAGIISLCPKQFRFLRSFYYRQFQRPLQTPQLWFRGYSPDNDAKFTSLGGITNAECLTVLICHSAAASVAHRQTIEILRAYKAKWNVKICIRGFLSYSGGDETSRDQLAQQLVDQADFADSIEFERSFLSLEELGSKLQEVDIAVFSCLRDEGVSLLTQFVKLGGVVSFNRFSINYDFFKVYAPSKLLTHEQFIEQEPHLLRKNRKLPADSPPRMLTFGELGQVSLDGGKLVFPTAEM